MVRFLSLLSLSLLIFSLHSNAASGRAEYDLDDDGLIEIDDLGDLDEIRNHLDGTSLYGESTGCPVEGCVGFELTTDLDVDTNADGVVDVHVLSLKVLNKVYVGCSESCWLNRVC
ncbi:MAG: hypothetical protein K6L76_01495 [Agarilytica sp.]